MTKTRILRGACRAVVVLLSVTPSAKAQLYTLQNNIVVSINESTGAVTNTGIAFPEDTFPYVGGTAVDPVHRRIFWLALDEDAGHSVLITINLAISVLSRVEVQGAVGNIEYDPDTERLYAEQASVIGKPAQIVSINPATGVVTPIGVSIPQSYSGLSAYDPIGRRKFSLASDGSDGTTQRTVLTSVSLETSTATHVSIPGSLRFMEYDPLTQLLYGYQVIFGDPTSRIVSINPVTGAVIPLAISGLPPGGFYQGASSFDVSSRRIFALGSKLDGYGSTITTISLSALTANQVNPPYLTFVIEFVPPYALPAAGPLLLALLPVVLGLAGTILSRKATPFSSS